MAYQGEVTGDFGRGDVLKAAAIVSMASVITAAYFTRLGAERAIDFVKSKSNERRQPQAQQSQTGVLSQSLDGFGVEW